MGEDAGNRRGREKDMYRKDTEGWLKHADFIVLDLVCLQIAYVLAYQWIWIQPICNYCLP